MFVQRSSSRVLSALRRLCIAAALAAAFCEPALAQSVLAFKYTPAPRAQIAIWIEDGTGRFLSTVALTEAVGYRGIGNRPGSSDMNSGYRWPYGRREGVLPIWAHRRAAAPGAQQFPRVVFQNRIEGLASRTAADHSLDSYYCLQFDAKKSALEELDAVSCATPFSSDKGRYLTEQDLMRGYGEPYEPQPGQGVLQPMPLKSLYPPRMDVARCTAAGCYDHTDVEHFAEDARAVMPDIDTVTIATPAGNSAQSVLFTVPASWPAGDYHAYIEVNVEGDYGAAWSGQRFPTPMTPMGDRDSFSIEYGYPYRGQPSIAWQVSFKLGAGADLDVGVAEPAGRSSWDYWAASYGALEPITATSTDPNAISADVPNSGTERLNLDANGRRFSVQAGKFATTDTTHTPDRPTSEPAPAPGGATTTAGSPATPVDAGVVMQAATSGRAAEPAAAAAMSGTSEPRDDQPETGEATPARPGPVRDLGLSKYGQTLHAHKWVQLRMRAVDSTLPLHAYEVRVATEPMMDEQTFIRQGRQAKNASDAKEGPSYLQLPTNVPAGDWIDATIGDLYEQTHYYLGVRARNVNNEAGPIAFAEFTTPKREFATVSPCFVATVAYGSPLAAEVGALRRLRDRYLLPLALGRGLVDVYYRYGAQLASWVRPHPTIRGALRSALTPLVALSKRLPD
jgi:hypothetical protein